MNERWQALIMRGDRLKRWLILEKTDTPGKAVIAVGIRGRERATVLAAAPDMLKALEQVDKGLSLLDQDKFGAMHLMVRTAIKKARE